jgi:hypothetical protein
MATVQISERKAHEMLIDQLRDASALTRDAKLESYIAMAIRRAEIVIRQLDSITKS